MENFISFRALCTQLFSRLRTVLSRKKLPSNTVAENQFKHMHEVINCEEMIGYVVDKCTGERTPTTWGVFHYGKDGIHIIPTTPRGTGENFWDPFHKHRLVDFFLSIERALPVHVIPSLRAITLKVDLIKEQACVSFFFDEKITPELFDLASHIFTESSADIVLPWTQYSFETIELRAPKPCPIDGYLLYHRYEPAFLAPDQSSLIIPYARVPYYNRLVTQQLLLGSVTPALKSIITHYDIAQKKVLISFEYDRKLSPLLKNLIAQVMQRAKKFFPKEVEIEQ